MLLGRLSPPMTHLHQSDWDALAEKRPFTSISTVHGKSRDDFWASGKRTADFLLESLPLGFKNFGTALDFGVGLGRIAFPMSARFKHVLGVDVSKVMLEKLNIETTKRNVQNIRGFHLDESWEKEPADFLYSVLTFQHMPDDEVRRALGRLRQALGGMGYFQFDTRPPKPFDIARFLPDWLLPWQWRSGMRRVSRPSVVVHSWLASAGFNIVKEFQPDSPLHGFLVEVTR